MKLLGINKINYNLVEKEWAKWLKKDNNLIRKKIRDEISLKYGSNILREDERRNMFKLIPLMEKKDLVNLYISILENNKN